MKHVVVENAASWMFSNLAWFCFGVSAVSVEVWFKIAAATAAVVASVFSVLASKATLRRKPTCITIEECAKCKAQIEQLVKDAAQRDQA